MTSIRRDPNSDNAIVKTVRQILATDGLCVTRQGDNYVLCIMHQGDGIDYLEIVESFDNRASAFEAGINYVIELAVKTAANEETPY